MPSPDNAAPRLTYTPEALAACEKALRTILTKIGPWGTKLILIGGMTPRFIVGTAPADMEEHIGTTDVDIVVGVSLATDEDEAYRTLQQNLKDAQFAPYRNPDTDQEETFRWCRSVDGVRVFLEFFCPVGDGTPGRLLRNPGQNIGSRISAIRTRGAELAYDDYFEVELKGELLDHGGIQESVKVKVAGLLPFVVLKAFALNERDKPKDSYDIVWTFNAFRDGPRSAVEEMAKSPVLNRPEVAEAIGYLRNHFQSTEHRGPSQFAIFQLLNADDSDGRERFRRDAHGTVAAFLRHWDLLNLPR
jgi:peptidoglycan hydrolase-like protein with peptidoglycan-binding domain